MKAPSRRRRSKTRCTRRKGGGEYTLTSPSTNPLGPLYDATSDSVFTMDKKRMLYRDNTTCKWYKCVEIPTSKSKKLSDTLKGAFLKFKFRKLPTKLQTEDTEDKLKKLDSIFDTDRCHFPEDFADITQIGHGGFSTVFSATITDSSLPKKRVAIKIIPIWKKVDESDDGNVNILFKRIERLDTEVKCMKLEKNKNLLRLLDGHYFVSTAGAEASMYKLGLNAFLVTPHCAYDLHAYYITNKKRTLSDTDALEIYKHIANGLICLHQNHIIHRDIKPQNVLYNSNTEQYQIADFGICKIFKDSDDLTTSHTLSVVGTPQYQAPEILFDSKYSLYTDIYGLGMSMIAIMLKKVPFEGMSAAKFAKYFTSITVGAEGQPSSLLCTIDGEDQGGVAYNALKHRVVKKRPTTLGCGFPSEKVSDYKQAWEWFDNIDNINNELLKVCKKCCDSTPQNRYDANSLYNQLCSITLQTTAATSAVRL